MNMVNAKYGSVPGLKAYTHVSDQFAPFACQSIPATVSEAPYILDGLLMNEVGRHVREQYADTAGFTDHLFGASSLLGYNLVLRIRDLPSKRLYVFNPDTTPVELRKLVGGKAREDLIVANWPDIFRCAATMTAGKNQAQPTPAQARFLPTTKTTLQLRFVKLVVLNGPFSLLSGSRIRTCSGVLRSVLTRERPTMRSKKCAPYREAGGNSRSHDRGAALPNRWAQFIDCGDHLLEYRPSWSCRHGAAERRVGCSP
uniref:Transposase n=1 Tax=Klebsiella pneumoniae TaxID=573 RepID=A0A8B0SXD5_KLEPN|nr:Transposase [Klebsiella pneumoniae]